MKEKFKEVHIDDLYDDPDFFNAYAQMARSQGGLQAAGEWHQMEPLLPQLAGMHVLDLGCGYGWHCKYAADKGAESVLGIDASKRMVEEARKRNSDPNITYQVCGLEEYAYPKEAFDLVISNLALHYVENLQAIYEDVWKTLKPGGVFLFNIEHPVFTAGVGQDWIYDAEGKPAHWPVDRYYEPGERETLFLGRKVRKQHHTLTQILNGLLQAGFRIAHVEEAMPSAKMLELPGMRDEMRRPMMLLVRAEKYRND